MSVHTYGGCGRLPCPGRGLRDCVVALGRRGYDFFLVGEAHLCQHYQSDALWEVLRHGGQMVPVVFGGVDYSDVLSSSNGTNGSNGNDNNGGNSGSGRGDSNNLPVLIDALQSRSPSALGRYLRHLHQYPSLLARYRQWRSHFEVVLERWTCALCDRLREASLPLGGGTEVAAQRPLCTSWPNLNFGGRR